MMDSKQSISSLYNTSSASDEYESTYLKRTRILHWARLGFSFIIFSAAVAVIGCEAAPLRHYRTTSELERVWLSLWPLNLDLRPTIGILSCGCIIAFQTLIYIVAALLPSRHSHIRLLNLLATASALSGFITALVGVIFAIYLPSSKYPSGFTENETIQSWTCKWKKPLDETRISSNGMSLHPPARFARDCAASRAGFVLLALLIGLEVVMGVAAAAGYWFEWTMTKRRRNEGLMLEKVETGSDKA